MSFFEIGIYQNKNKENLGTLWRSAYQLGASGIFTIGSRYRHQCSDTVKSYRHIPLRNYLTFEEFKNALPLDCEIVAIEMGGISLYRAKHPQSCVYLLGAEDYGLPVQIMAQCHKRISLDSLRVNSYNVAVAGSIVMYDRMEKLK